MALRIVAGRFRGKRLTPPEGRDIRPTAERVREALFNILMTSPHLPAPLSECRFLDAFAGSGAVGLEALSRGMPHAVFMEKNGPSQALIRENVGATGAGEKTRLLKTDITAPPPAEAPVQVAFLDPPYTDETLVPALCALREAGWITPGTLCITETSARMEPDLPEAAEILDTRHYGAARLTFLRLHGNGASNLMARNL